MSLSREEVIRMARECFTEEFFTHEVEEFAERIAAAEREACAKVCERHADPSSGIMAEAIRARGNGGGK